MSLNLKTLPLANLETFAVQKCLLPKTKFPAAMRPGTWCKCHHDDAAADSCYSVCQVFPREHLPADNCYMDCTVGSSSSTLKNTEATNVLYKLEPLQLQELAPHQVTLNFIITEELFANKLDKVSLIFLLHLAQQYLQSLHLVAGAQIQLPDLQQVGVAAIEIFAVEDLNSANAFQINNETLLIVNDVKLLAPQHVVNETAPFYNCGFELAQQQLQDLLQVVAMERLCNWQLRPSMNALLVGAAGCGKSALAQWFVRENHCNCFRITAANVLGQYPGETEAALRQKFQAVKTFKLKLQPKLPTVVLIEDLHLLCPVTKLSASDAGNALRICAQLLQLVDDLHASRVGVMCLGATSAPEILNELARRPGRFEREIVIAAPTEHQRLQLFAALFSDCSYAAKYQDQLQPALLEMVAKQTQGFAVADLQLLLRNVGQRLLRDSSLDFALTLKQALQQAKPTSLRGTEVSVYKTDQRFDSIGGMQQLKRTLEISVLAGLKKHLAFKRFGLNLPKGVLLYGPPGCAKTTIAKCLATEANMTFIATSGAEVYSPYVGCAEKFIAKLFDTARKHAPCLIFLDEIDTLVGRRNSDTKGDIQIRILSTLLTEMDGIVCNTSTPQQTNYNHILVVAATNRPDMLDDALMRPGRFDKLIHVPAPDWESRREILNLYAKRMPFGDDVDLDAIAACTENYSGADICNLCNEAALHALHMNFEATRISADDFAHVLQEQSSSLTQTQIQWYFNFENKFVR